MLRPALVALALLGCAQGPVDLAAGDTQVHAEPDGSFRLTVGGRVLLAGAPAPVAVQQFDPLVPLLWGQFPYQTGPVTTVTATRLAGGRIEGPDLVLSLDGDARATLRFTPADGEVLLKVRAESSLAARALLLRFACDPAARFLGFGEQYQTLDHRGEAFPLFVAEQGIGRDPAKPGPYAGDPWTTYFPVPFFLDPRGFGVAVETDARVEVDLCKSDPQTWSATVEEPREVTLHVYTGPTPADVLRVFTGTIQGRSAAAPRWSVDGAWLGVQGGPQKVKDAVARAKKAGVPVGAVWVQDWVGRLDLGGGLWELQYHWTPDQTHYPDLPGLTRELRAGGVHFLGYFNPFVLPKHDQWKEGVEKGYLIRKPDGTPYKFLITIFEGTVVDLTNPDAVAWFQTFARAAVAMGMDGWMDDFGEWLPYDALLHDGDPTREHNRYPTRWHRASREVLSPDQLIFSRSGWLGEAQAAQVVWAGDQEADWSRWDGLPTVVPAMISLGLVGISWVTHDIAGFSGGPSTKELYLRWMELGAFTPIFRTHEGLAADNNWSWFADEETLRAFSRWSRVHAKLAPTFVALGDEHLRTGMPIVRALALGWPDDARAVTVSDQFTVGADLLVAPVVEKGAMARKVYFPAGTWYDVWDPSKRFDGPAEVMVDAPLGRPPVFSTASRTDLGDIQ